MNNNEQSFKSGEIDPDFPPITIPNPTPGERDFSVDTVLRLADGHLIAGCQDDIYRQPPCLVRIKPDNSLDTSFGQNGYAFTDVRNDPLAEDDGYLLDAHLLPDGRYLARLETTATFQNQRVTCLALACFTADGQKDPLFGNSGLRLYSLPGQPPQWPQALRKLGSHIPEPRLRRFPHEQFGDLKVLDDGKLLVLTGAKDMIEQTHRTYVLRLTPDGEPDPTFNTNGQMEPEGYMWFRPYRLLTQANGMVVISGEHPGIPFIARFHENGTLDTAFGSEGYFTDFGNYAYSRWHTLWPDTAGNIICAGNRGGPTIAHGRGVVAIGKIDRNGQRTPDFNEGETLLIESRDTGNAVPASFMALVDSAGRTVLCGKHMSETLELSGFMARVLDNGQVDTTLGEDGVRYYEETDGLNYMIEAPDTGHYYASAVIAGGYTNRIHRFIS